MYGSNLEFRISHALKKSSKFFIANMASTARQYVPLFKGKCVILMDAKRRGEGKLVVNNNNSLLTFH